VLRLSFPKKPSLRESRHHLSLREGRLNGFFGRTTKQSFFDNRKEIEIASLAGLARNDGRILALREGRHHLALREGRHHLALRESRHHLSLREGRPNGFLGRTTKQSQPQFLKCPALGEAV
jgi:hypothetical protein